MAASLVATPSAAVSAAPQEASAPAQTPGSGGGDTMPLVDNSAPSLRREAGAKLPTTDPEISLGGQRHEDEDDLEPDDDIDDELPGRREGESIVPKSQERRPLDKSQERPPFDTTPPKDDDDRSIEKIPMFASGGPVKSTGPVTASFAKGGPVLNTNRSIFAKTK